MVAAIVRGKCRRLASGGDRLQVECEMQAQAGHGRRPVIGHANRRQGREDLEAEVCGNNYAGWYNQSLLLACAVSRPALSLTCFRVDVR